jgi:hypothetical protein
MERVNYTIHTYYIAIQSEGSVSFAEGFGHVAFHLQTILLGANLLESRLF